MHRPHRPQTSYTDHLHTYFYSFQIRKSHRVTVNPQTCPNSFIIDTYLIAIQFTSSFWFITTVGLDYLPNETLILMQNQSVI